MLETGKLFLIVVWIDTKRNQNKIMTIFVAYRPSKNKSKVKDLFWDQLQDEMDLLNHKAILVGDLNGRVGTYKQRPVRSR